MRCRKEEIIRFQHHSGFLKGFDPMWFSTMTFIEIIFFTDLLPTLYVYLLSYLRALIRLYIPLRNTLHTFFASIHLDLPYCKLADKEVEPSNLPCVVYYDSNISAYIPHDQHEIIQKVESKSHNLLNSKCTESIV